MLVPLVEVRVNDGPAQYFDVPDKICISGGGGDDTIVVKDVAGNETWSLDGTLDFDPSEISVSGGTGNDSIRVVAESQHIEIDGGAGNDRLQYVGGADALIVGGGGDDMLKGSAGRDTLRGGSGDDRLVGGAGHDRLFGGSGDDRLQGQSGRDRLFGELGRDSLDGGADADRLDGGAGSDWLRSNLNDRLFSGSDLIEMPLYPSGERFVPGDFGDWDSIEFDTSSEVRKAEELVDDLVRQSEEDALRRIDEAGLPGRVTSRDGERFIFFADYVEYRINLEIESGIVTRAYVG
jgi:hypothetical protein